MTPTPTPITARLALAAAFALLAGSALAQMNTPGQHFVENWDLDGDGKVTLEEATTRRGEVFYTFDSDEDGALSAEEYVQFDEARANDQAQMHQGGGQGSGAMQMSEGMELAFNDTDGDGRVTQEEFLSRAADWMTMMDRDGDGAISVADFGRGG